MGWCAAFVERGGDDVLACMRCTLLSTSTPRWALSANTTTHSTGGRRCTPSTSHTASSMACMPSDLCGNCAMWAGTYRRTCRTFPRSLSWITRGTWRRTCQSLRLPRARQTPRSSSTRQAKHAHTLSHTPSLPPFLPPSLPISMGCHSLTPSSC